MRVSFTPGGAVTLLNILLPSSFSAETWQAQRDADGLNYMTEHMAGRTQ